MKKFIILALALAVASCGGPIELTADQSTMAELGARDIADRSQSTFIGCSGQDSDRDGYVTCTVQKRTTAQEAPVPEEALLCAYKSRGCKRK